MATLVRRWARPADTCRSSAAAAPSESPETGEGAMAGEARQASGEQRDRLRDMAQNDEDAVADIVRIEVAASGIDARTHALTNLAAVITSGVPDPANYVLHVTRALDAGCSADEVIGTMV